MEEDYSNQPQKTRGVSRKVADIAIMKKSTL